MVKICKNCKYFKQNDDGGFTIPFYQCLHPNLMPEEVINIITGATYIRDKHYNNAVTVRFSDDHCTEEGKWYEER